MGSLGAATIAVAAWFGSCQSPPNDAGRTAHPRVNGDGARRTVCGTGTAFHAGVLVSDMRLLIRHGKDRMRADGHTLAAANAGFLVKVEAHDVLEIGHHGYMISGQACGCPEDEAKDSADKLWDKEHTHLLLDAGKRREGG